jgi:hypothetical protein
MQRERKEKRRVRQKERAGSERERKRETGLYVIAINFDPSLTCIKQHTIRLEQLSSSIMLSML